MCDVSKISIKVVVFFDPTDIVVIVKMSFAKYGLLIKEVCQGIIHI